MIQSQSTNILYVICVRVEYNISLPFYLTITLPFSNIITMNQ